MELLQIYQLLGGNYAAMHRRIRKDEFILHLLREFIHDEEFAKLEKAMENHDDKAAFEAAHALKGVALNLELGALAEPICALTEALRHGREPQADALFEKSKQEYYHTMRIVKEVLEYE